MQVRQRNPSVPLQHPWVTHLNPPVTDEPLQPEAPFAMDVDGGDAAAFGEEQQRRAFEGGKRISVGGYDAGAGMAPGKVQTSAPLLQSGVGVGAAGGGRLLPMPRLPAGGGKAGGMGAGGMVGGRSQPLAMQLLGGGNLPGSLVEQQKLLALMQATMASGVMPVVPGPPLAPSPAHAQAQAALQQQMQSLAAARAQLQKRQAPPPPPAASAPPAAAASASAAAAIGNPPGAISNPGGDDSAVMYKGVTFVATAPQKRRYRASYARPDGTVIWKKGFEGSRAAAIVWDCVALAVEGPGAGVNFTASEYSDEEIQCAAHLVWKQSPGVEMLHPACAGLRPKAESGGGASAGGAVKEEVKEEAAATAVSGDAQQ